MRSELSRIASCVHAISNASNVATNDVILDIWCARTDIVIGLSKSTVNIFINLWSFLLGRQALVGIEEFRILTLP